MSVIGSVLFGAMTVADAWVLGWATDHVIRPSFERGEIAEGALAAAIALFIAVAILRALGIIGRRLIGGIVYYRLVADYRRRVTRKYLSLPMAWHHRHPTGQLLSNANADVEAHLVGVHAAADGRSASSRCWSRRSSRWSPPTSS